VLQQDLLLAERLELVAPPLRLAARYDHEVGARRAQVPWTAPHAWSEPIRGLARELP
jgi:hypothetical protein